MWLWVAIGIDRVDELRSEFRTTNLAFGQLQYYIDLARAIRNFEINSLLAGHEPNRLVLDNILVAYSLHLVLVVDFLVVFLH